MNKRETGSAGWSNRKNRTNENYGSPFHQYLYFIIYTEGELYTHIQDHVSGTTVR